jgi:uncharacterized membrane protein affecting hemolysin expression
MARVKLTSWSDLVKPDREVLKVAAVTALVTAIALLLVAYATDREQERMDQFGAATARALAELVVEPLLKQDRMHLGVIGNRLADIPQVDAVASYTLDNEVLASTGTDQALPYAEAVTVDGSIVGYVRVGLDPQAFAELDPTRMLLNLLVLLLLPFVIASSWSLTQPARRQELVARLPRLPANPPWAPRHLPAPKPEAPVALPEPEPDPAEVVHYLVAVNLYNQLSLPPTEREFELSLCVELAEAVAGIYQGQVVGVAGLGAVVSFDHTDDPDRPFQIICAAQVLARLLREEAPFGVYRLGLNLTLRPADEPLPVNDDAIADAALLSALAKDATLALSQPFAAALAERERVVMKPLVNPLLDELTTSNAGCYLVTELEAPYAAEVIHKAEQLRSQREGISSPSTF